MFGPLPQFRTAVRASRQAGYPNMSHMQPNIYDMAQAAMMAPSLGYWLPNNTQPPMTGHDYAQMQVQQPQVGYAPRQNRPFQPTRGPSYIGRRRRGNIRYGKGTPSWR